MPKFLIVGDIHYRGNNPISRTDDFPAAIEAKMDEVHRLAKELKIDAILQTGDLFDSPACGLGVIAKILKAQSKYGREHDRHEEIGQAECCD